MASFTGQKVNSFGTFIPFSAKLEKNIEYMQIFTQLFFDLCPKT
jgi:hypothetical protein